MYDGLHGALYAMQETGSLGFEGFIRDLISVLTGRTFFLSRSGSQAGKDASTAGYGATYIDIECKRYRPETSPTARDLLGGLEEAIQSSLERLDLWLLVSTGAIGSGPAAALRRVGGWEGDRYRDSRLAADACASARAAIRCRARRSSRGTCSQVAQR